MRPYLLDIPSTDRAFARQIHDFVYKSIYHRLFPGWWCIFNMG